jgi:hypothetical protein
MILYQDSPILKRFPVTDGLPRAPVLYSRSHPGLTECVRASVHGVPDHLMNRVVDGWFPDCSEPELVANCGWESQLLFDEPEHDLADASEFVEFAECKMDGFLNPLIRVDLHFPVMGPAKPDGQAETQLAAACLHSDGFHGSLPKQVEFELRHRSLVVFYL